MRFLLFFVTIVFSLIFYIFSRKLGENIFHNFHILQPYGDTLYLSLLSVAGIFLIIAIFFLIFFTDFKKKKQDSYVNQTVLWDYIINYKKEAFYLIITFLGVLFLYGVGSYFGFSIQQFTFFYITIHLILFYNTLWFIKNKGNKNIFVYTQLLGIFSMYAASIFGIISLYNTGQHFVTSVVITYLLGINILQYYWYSNAISAILSLCLFSVITYVYLFDFFIGIIIK